MQVALAAAATLDAAPALTSTLLDRKVFERRRDSVRAWAARVRTVTLVAFVLAATSRTAAVLIRYQAPMATWWRLQQALGPAAHRSQQCGTVCVGEEWYRFPSSFFLPDGAHLAFVDSAFDGAQGHSFALSGRALPLSLCAFECAHGPTLTVLT